MLDLTNEFSWSRSRDSLFQDCRRKYFYHYYGAWGGWEVGAPAEARTLYVLKQLNSRQQWAGKVVHEGVEWVLRALYAGRELPEADKNEGLVLKARGLLARKDYEQAQAILEELSARNPRWVYPKVILSHVLLQEGKDSAAAERVLREIVDLDPSQGESWRNLAVLLRHQAKLAQAAGVCRSARLHCPQDVDLILLQGVVLRENGDLEDAETCFLAVIGSHWPVHSQKAQQGRIEARHQLALLYGATDRLQEAEAQWREVLAESPEHSGAHQGLDTLQRQRNGKQEVLATVF